MRKVYFLISFVLCLILVTAPAFGLSFKKSVGQIVYVPANQNYIIDNSTWRVVTRLIIRNVDLNHQITVNSIKLYGPDGEMVDHDFLSEPEDLDSLNSRTYGIPFPITWNQNDGRPGFIVRWTASGPVIAPIIESATAIIDTSVSPPNFEGVSFNQGRVLKELWWTGD